MIVTIASDADLDRIRRALTGLGLWVESVERTDRGPTHLVVGRASSAVAPATVAELPGVVSVALARSARPRVDAHGPAFEILGRRFDRQRPLLIAGPCAVESEEQVHRIAEKLRGRGVSLLRGGAFKPRTSPYDFQGLGSAALGWLRRAADHVGLGVVTEVMSERDVGDVARTADVLQIGSRNMQNYSLLKAAGGAQKPVLLKRSMAATVDEWLLAGEYLLVHGAKSVAFCERGIRSFDPSTRNLLDLGAVALLSHSVGVPVIVDPSHAAGRRDLILPLARAALAAGATGLMIEVHDEPSAAESDGAQALPPEALAGLGLERWGSA